MPSAAAADLSSPAIYTILLCQSTNSATNVLCLIFNLLRATLDPIYHILTLGCGRARYRTLKRWTCHITLILCFLDHHYDFTTLCVSILQYVIVPRFKIVADQPTYAAGRSFCRPRHLLLYSLPLAVHNDVLYDNHTGPAGDIFRDTMYHSPWARGTTILCISSLPSLAGALVP